MGQSYEEWGRPTEFLTRDTNVYSFQSEQTHLECDSEASGSVKSSLPLESRGDLAFQSDSEESGNDEPAKDSEEPHDDVSSYGSAVTASDNLKSESEVDLKSSEKTKHYPQNRVDAVSGKVLSRARRREHQKRGLYHDHINE